MRVLFDHQIVDAQLCGGISRYFYELTSTIRDAGWASVRLPPICFENEHFGPPPGGIRSRIYRALGRTELLRKAIGRPWRQANSRLNERASVRALREQEFDVFHPTYYRPYFLDPLQGKPFVLTIYDMIHELHPEHFRPDDPTAAHKAALAGAAARIIAISERTKADIVSCLNVDPERIEVIYLANSLDCGEEAVAVPESYLLYVGDRNRYKNFPALFLAFAALARSRPDLHLVCVSPKRFRCAELDLIEEFGLEGRCVHLRANDRQLAYLYRHASLFVYPSLYEGFGMPILEAFAAGCPVALSDASCFPEIAGEAGLYFDPSNVASIAAALERGLACRESRRRLIREGRERLKRFSWATTAERTAAVYERCVGEGGGLRPHRPGLKSRATYGRPSGTAQSPGGDDRQ
ncbi:MAG TPA: glycosyltransferase family 1 protein [Thermoanaerobaculia bacterium]